AGGRRDPGQLGRRPRGPPRASRHAGDVPAPPWSHYLDRYDQYVSNCRNAPGGLPGEGGPAAAAATPVTGRGGGGPSGAGRGRRRWAVLAAGTVALTAGCTFQYGLAYLIPALRGRGLSLAEAGLLVACPTVGLLLTLVAWGAIADRRGERLVLASGLGTAGLVLLAATRVHG